MELEITLMNAEELSSFLGISIATTYSYTANSGVNGGKKRQRFNPEVYRKIGTKLIFLQQKVLEHLNNNTLLIQGS